MSAELLTKDVVGSNVEATVITDKQESTKASAKDFEQRIDIGTVDVEPDGRSRKEAYFKWQINQSQ